MKRRVFESLIYRYHQNKANKAERDLVDRWYDAIDQEEVPDSCVDQFQLWNRIHAQITATSPSKKPIWKMVRRAATLAASLLLCFGFLFWNKMVHVHQEQKQVVPQPGFRIFETGIAQRKRVQLADGSTVILNARTQLKIDTVSFGLKDRVIELLAGEAFFEVKKDSTKAFIVKAHELQTKVLGTSFTVKNYAELEEISVSVFTGRVQVSGNNNLLGVLNRGDEIRYSKSSHENKQNRFDIDTRNSWIEGRIYLKQADFTELALAVKNIYGINLKAANRSVAKQRYSMPIVRQLSWPATLESIKQIHYNKSRKEGNKVIIY